MSFLRRFRSSFKPPETISTSDPKPESASLVDLYKIALDEYRFQVNLNWSRTQYFIILNLGILGLATGLLRLDDERLSAIVGTGLYFTGVICCILALVAGSVQRSYYRQTKTHKARIEALLGLGDLAIRTTPGMGSTARRLAKVTTFHNAILSILLLLDCTGLTYSIWQVHPLTPDWPCLRI